MSPAPRKKKDEEAPTAAEVEAKASEEAGESVPKAEDEKPKAKKKPAAKKKAAPKAEAAQDTSTDDAEAAEDTSAEEEKPAKKPAAKKAAPKAEAKPAAKPARKRDQPRARRAPDEPAVLVSAKARYVRTSARKARLVCDHIRGKDVEQARAILSFTPRGAAKPWLKLLESAIANAEHNHELVGDELKIASIHADEGPTLKRYRPRAMGRATRIRKRTSHLTITLTPKE
jgi:ribosomal protein L22